MRRVLLGALVLGIALTAVRLYRRDLPRLADGESRGGLGVFHVHSTDSHDGRQSRAEIAKRAAALGLDFVVFTEHEVEGAGPATMLEGVVALSYPERRAEAGHVIQVGGPPLVPLAPSPLLALRAAGLSPVVAHPTDVKRSWEGSLEGAAGFEIANTAATVRRVAMRPPWAAALQLLAAWPLNRRLSLAALIERDAAALQLWDGAPGALGFCGADSHGRFGLDDELSVWRLLLEAPLPEDPAARPAAVEKLVSEGRFVCVAAPYASRPRLGLEAHGPLGSVAAPARVDLGIDSLHAFGPIAAADSVAEPLLVLLRNGVEIQRHVGASLVYLEPPAGCYRLEARLPSPELLFGEHLATVAYSQPLCVASTPASEPSPAPGEVGPPAPNPAPATSPDAAPPAVEPAP